MHRILLGLFFSVFTYAAMAEEWEFIGDGGGAASSPTFVQLFYVKNSLIRHGSIVDVWARYDYKNSNDVTREQVKITGFELPYWVPNDALTKVE